VEAALAGAAGDTGVLDSITISGHGEATLHPELPEVVDRILAVARRAWPGVPVRILTNGSQAVSPRVRSALDRLDERIVKLDADSEHVCRPTRGHPPGARLLGLSLLRDVTLQSCFIEGSVSNTDEETVTEWVELVSEIAPRAVQIYTIDQPPATAEIRPVGPSRLEEIACQLRGRTGIEARVYG
jgi:wyosine [tRNA(Phe)-imidazoG37] synthetase (radical SAM superfamily)